jgi:hypothetical protein
MKRDLEDRMRASQIVTEAGMSDRPEYYSGRGAISCDLNDKILEEVYRGVQREHGKKAAEQFVQMVADVPKLSATDFLLSLYRLESRNWKWDKKMVGSENGLDVGPDTGDGSRFAVGMFSVANVLSGMSERDETRYIRGSFLQKHGIKIPGNVCSYGFYC